MSRLKRAGKAFGMGVFVDPTLPPDEMRVVGGTVEKPHVVRVINLGPSPPKTREK